MAGCTESRPFAQTSTAPLSGSDNAPDRSRFTFQHPWFDDEIRPSWEELSMPLRGKKLQILEVGSFEGCSTTWVLDNLMSHPESRMTVIDTFEGGMEHQGSASYDIAGLESRFRSNVSKCEHVGKLRTIVAKSDDALMDLRREDAHFDFIYLDASHTAIDVLYDAVLCWRMLGLEGTLVFDDVAWKGYLEDCYNPRIAIRSFLQCTAHEMTLTESEWQLWVKKVEAHTRPTPNPDPGLAYEEKSLLKDL